MKRDSYTRHALLRYVIRPSFGFSSRYQLILYDAPVPRYAVHYSASVIPDKLRGRVFISAERAEALLKRVERIRTPLFPAGAGGVDGTTYSLTLERGFNRLKLTWWEEIPAPAQEISGVLDELIELAGKPFAHLPKDVLVWLPDRSGNRK